MVPKLTPKVGDKDLEGSLWLNMTHHEINPTAPLPSIASHPRLAFILPHTVEILCPKKVSFGRFFHDTINWATGSHFGGALSSISLHQRLGFILSHTVEISCPNKMPLGWSFHDETNWATCSLLGGAVPPIYFLVLPLNFSGQLWRHVEEKVLAFVHRAFIFIFYFFQMNWLSYITLMYR